jgi:hypothetical protein
MPPDLQEKLHLLQSVWGVEGSVTTREERDDFDGSLHYTGLLTIKNQTFESIAPHSSPIDAIRAVILFALDYFEVKDAYHVEVPAETNAVAKLSRFAHNNKLSIEWQVLSEDRTEGFSYQVSVGGLSFVSATKSKKKDAKNEAALVATNSCRLP